MVHAIGDGQWPACDLNLLMLSSAEPVCFRWLFAREPAGLHCLQQCVVHMLRPISLICTCG
jgi:hypothetical protein